MGIIMNSVSEERDYRVIRPTPDCFCMELHMHTSQSSACGMGTPAEMVAAYLQAGYDGILLTDHFLNGNTCVDRSQPWEKQIDDYCLAYEMAKAEGDKVGLAVYFGYEFNYYTTEFITIGMDKNWLKAHPEIMTMTPEEYLQLVRRDGGINIHAHPFREEKYIHTHRFYPDLVDAVEVLNLGNKKQVFNDRAYEYAVKHHLPMTSGSDCHSPKGKKGAGIALEKKPESIQDIISCIRSGKGYKVLGLPFSEQK